MNSAARFKDPLKTIESFGDHFLVVCPGCGQCAHVSGGGAGGRDGVRFVCPACGRSEHWRGNRGSVHQGGGKRTKSNTGVLRMGGPVDWYFHYPVWLTVPCCGETLWAYNEAHLDYLQSFVSAALRERAPLPGSTPARPRPRNSSLASRLPAWLTAAKNRARVLAAIAKLRRLLPAQEPRA